MIKTKNVGVQKAIRIMHDMSLIESMREMAEYNRKQRMDRKAQDAYVYDQGKEEGRAEGKAEGKAAALLTVLSSKGKVSEELEKKIQAQTKSELLDQWLRIAANEPDVDAFEERINHP